MLNSYIFVIRKQNATRNCNVLFEFLYFGFVDPPIVHVYEGVGKGKNDVPVCVGWKGVEVTGST